MQEASLQHYTPDSCPQFTYVVSSTDLFIPGPHTKHPPEYTHFLPTQNKRKQTWVDEITVESDNPDLGQRSGNTSYNVSKHHIWILIPETTKHRLTHPDQVEVWYAQPAYDGSWNKLLSVKPTVETDTEYGNVKKIKKINRYDLGYVPVYSSLQMANGTRRIASRKQSAKSSNSICGSRTFPSGVQLLAISSLLPRYDMSLVRRRGCRVHPIACRCSYRAGFDISANYMCMSFIVRP